MHKTTKTILSGLTSTSLTAQCTEPQLTRVQHLTNLGIAAGHPPTTWVATWSSSSPQAKLIWAGLTMEHLRLLSPSLVPRGRSSRPLSAMGKLNQMVGELSTTYLTRRETIRFSSKKLLRRVESKGVSILTYRSCHTRIDSSVVCSTAMIAVKGSSVESIQRARLVIKSRTRSHPTLSPHSTKTMSELNELNQIYLEK